SRSPEISTATLRMVASTIILFLWRRRSARLNFFQRQLLASLFNQISTIRTRDVVTVGSGRFTQVVSDAVSYSVAYQRVSSNRRNYNGPAVDPAFSAFVPFGDFEFLNVNRGNIDTVDSRVNFRLSRSNLLTAGFEFERESLFQSSQPSFTTFNNTTDRQRTFAVFGQDQLSFLDDRLRMSLGVRGQWYRIRSADRPGVLQGREAESSITGDGAIAYFIRGSGTKLR